MSHTKRATKRATKRDPLFFRNATDGIAVLITRDH